MSDSFLPGLPKALAAIRSAETGPLHLDLNNAPQLELWVPVRNRFGVLALWGQVADHPEFGADDIVTSPLVAWNPAERWARSISRWYRLGQPFFSLNEELAPQMGGTASSLTIEIAGVRPLDDLDFANRLIEIFVNHIRQRAREIEESPREGRTS